MDDPAFEHGTLDGDGVRLHYAAAGEGPLMVFVHGFPEFWYAWRKLLAEFSCDHRVVAYDQRGYNLSDKPDGVENYRSGHLVADLAAVIRHFGRKRAIVVGHDWGGVVAWAFAIARPEMVEKLVIGNAPHPGVFARLLSSDAEQQRASGYIAKYQGADAEPYLSRDDFAVLRSTVTEPGRVAGYFNADDAAAYLAAWRQPGALTAMLNFYRAMHLLPPHKDGRPAKVPAIDAQSVAVAAPTLVIWGMKDRYLLPQNLDGLDAFVPDLTIHEIAEATHWVFHEKPEEASRVMRDFIAR
ncbi:MAG TPA: alpha/beta hydrolase [Alphaproteobacteria bacterium]|nr:alpha/beta hydrolase [Alphaproteobacteria bacterium]